MRKLYFGLVALFAIGISNALADGENATGPVQYWIDNRDEDAQLSDSLNFTVDCKELPAGLHFLRYRVADSSGRFSPLNEHGFYKTPVIKSATKIDSLMFWWDDFHINAVSAVYNDSTFILSTSALPYGLHSLKYRVVDDAGRWSETKTHYFYKGEQRDSAMITGYFYWWNDLSADAELKWLESPAKTFEIDEKFNVPEKAKTNYAGHYTATLHIAFLDNLGRTAFHEINVEYPDNDPPLTDIDADKYVASKSVTINWKETSSDSMGDYNVYFSKDNSPFLLWLPDTKQTSATFKGEKGSFYRFTVTGRDSFGNREKYDESKCVSVTFE